MISFILIFLGGGIVCGVDNVSRIQDLCHKHEAWLHVEGHSLAALTLPNTPNLVYFCTEKILVWDIFALQIDY